MEFGINGTHRVIEDDEGELALYTFPEMKLLRYLNRNERDFVKAAYVKGYHDGRSDVADQVNYITNEIIGRTL